MDNKKLMHTLLRDVRELEQLTGDMKQAGTFDALDIELILTRISGVRHLLEVAAQNQEKEISTPVKTKSEKQPVQETSIPEPLLTVKEVGPNQADNLPKAEEQSQPAVGKVEVQTKMTESFHLSEEIQVVTPSGNGNEQAEEKTVAGEKQILAEKFTAGKSVNDLLLERGKSDPRFTHLPLNNLAGAIGINDRFLFTRELFEGNADAFSETVRVLDAMHSIQEAADYLREHFQWNKSETSLKFIDLVKRRFL